MKQSDYDVIFSQLRSIPLFFFKIQYHRLFKLLSCYDEIGIDDNLFCFFTKLHPQLAACMIQQCLLICLNK